MPKMLSRLMCQASYRQHDPTQQELRCTKCHRYRMGDCYLHSWHSLGVPFKSSGQSECSVHSFPLKVFVPLTSGTLITLAIISVMSIWTEKQLDRTTPCGRRKDAVSFMLPSDGCRYVQRFTITSTRVLKCDGPAFVVFPYEEHSERNLQWGEHMSKQNHQCSQSKATGTAIVIRGAPCSIILIGRDIS
jgi:hypothetical protein